jgi:hypothetical protein
LNRGFSGLGRFSRKSSPNIFPINLYTVPLVFSVFP